MDQHYEASMMDKRIHNVYSVMMHDSPCPLCLLSPLGYKGSMDQKELGTRKISRLVPEMAFPLIVAQLVNGLYNLVDRIYLGHIEGSGATILTGVGITYPIILLITAFSSLIGNGGGPLSAIRMGQGRRD